ARIKKIMQLDEDVGKVAQATPILISKALEMFMQSLIDQACQETRLRNAKRLSVAHLKRTIETTEQFDFLKDIVANVPDPGDASMHSVAPMEDVKEENGKKPAARSSRRKPAGKVKEEM
ncbi:histone-fold-containing protein, partial [Radiomyces spectabilis]|uniref:histone-fold-containing protein n=1 Tax=Radiomyces spectabilis TaxID=64574 RepID=UPI00221E3D3D